MVLDIGDSQITRGLERALNAEISMHKEQKEMLGDYKKYSRELDPGVLQQPGFVYQAAGDKMVQIQKYIDLIKEQDRTREAILLLKRTAAGENFDKLTKDFNNIFRLIKELDSE